MASLNSKQYAHLLCASLVVASAGIAGAQAPPPIKPNKPPGAPAAPAAPAVSVVSPATLNRLFKEAEDAFAAKEYTKVVEKLNELIKALGNRQGAPFEMLYFNIGLAHLLGGNNAQAEEAFTDCLKKFPKGEYASRCYLGVGRACMQQDGDDKKQRAIEALTKASVDPKYRSEAGLYLGQVYIDTDKPEEALKVFRSLMGSDVKSPTQTGAAVQVIGLLADTGKLEDLVAYLDRLLNQEGVRDSMAWYANQVIVRADELVGAQQYDAALAIYRSIPPRQEIISIQQASLEAMRKDSATLKARVAAEASRGIEQRSNVGELLSMIDAAIGQAETALAAIEGKADLDAAILMRRGRCLYYLDRHEEALAVFRTMRLKYENAPDAKAAAFAEVVLFNTLKNTEQLLTLGTRYLRKYPDAENAEQVALLVGEILVQKGDWAKVADWYADLIKRFPKSTTLDRYNFYLGVAKFQTGDHAGSAALLNGFIKSFPNSEMVETATYYVAMAYFLTNNYKEALAGCKAYLSRFPNGRYAGDMVYRLAFIDSNDKTVKPEKIVRDLDAYLQVHPDDLAAGSMLTLLADTAKKMTADPAKGVDPEAIAFDAFKKAIYTESPEDVIQYALDSATTILQGRKDWAGIAELHGDFVKKFPKSNLVMTSIGWISKSMARMGKVNEATQLIADTLKAEIGNPASELVEQLIDELVKSFVPRNIKPANIDVDAIDKQLVEVLTKVVEGKNNATTNARVYYARARLAQALKRNDKSELYLKGIATNATDPAALSPMLLTVVGDILLKNGKLDEAQAMFQRLKDRYSDSSFSDSGPVGLGQVALARKKPDEALKIFNNAIETIPGMSRFKEANLGKLEAMVELGEFENAEKLADNMIGDKSFRGEGAGKAYLLKALSLRRQAAKAQGIDASRELLKQARAVYQRVQGAYKAAPEVYAEALWQEHKTALDLRDDENAKKILEFLLNEPKLKNTARRKDAEKELNK
jgi:TolA-binding protein